MNLNLYNLFKVFALFFVFLFILWLADWLYYKIVTEKGKWKKLE